MANTGGAIFSPYSRDMRTPEGYGKEPTSARNRHWGSAGGYSSGFGRNYVVAIDQDENASDEMLNLIKNVELRINAIFSRVNDSGAFDIEEIGCLFQRMMESLPNRAVLERRAGL